jgi:hypothetical protein
MLPVDITVGVGPRRVAVDELADPRVACAVHKKKAQRVRVHFDARGNADLQYDSCCEALGAQIGAQLR